MRKILIVDDSTYMRMFIKKIITKSGLNIMFEAGSKEEAVELFTSAKPDIVILDLNMSEKEREGIDILTEIMKIDPNAYVIIISAVGYEHVKDECVTLGAKGYIKKPFETKDLLMVL
jgi:two-component system chemotaxis response regulator CheY